MTESKFKITQVISADGWFAAYKQDDGSFYFEPLISWALAEISEDGETFQKMLGISAADAASPEEYYPCSENFVGYNSSFDFSELGLSLKQGVKPRNAWGS